MTAATATNAQREPSMEEILASIRRIIEESDGGKPEETAHTEPNRAIAADLAEAEAFNAELRAAVANDGRRTERPLSGDASAPKNWEPATLGSRKPETKQADRPGESVAARAEPSAGVSAKASDTLEQASTTTAAPQSLPLHSEVTDAAGPAETPAAEGQPQAALVSRETGRQVAASFGELSEAFAARSRRTFDEMAAEMLQPLLKDWLDNNLPLLVERLVREEIERIARGT